MPNFAVSTICFGPEADACEVLDFAIRHGFQGIELSSYHFWPERLRADEIDRLRASIKQHGMRLAIHARHRGISFGAHDATLRQGFVEELQATVRFAAELGGDVVVAHVGEIVPPANHPSPSEQTLRQEAFAVCRRFLCVDAPPSPAIAGSASALKTCNCVRPKSLPRSPIICGSSTRSAIPPWCALWILDMPTSMAAFRPAFRRLDHAYSIFISMTTTGRRTNISRSARVPSPLPNFRHSCNISVT